MAAEIPYSVSLVESQKQVENLILEELAKLIKPIFDQAIQPIQEDLKKIVHTAIIKSEEMQSLSGGILQYDLGLFSGQAANAVLVVAQSVSESIIVTSKPIVFNKKGAGGGMVIEIQPSSFDNITKLPTPWNTDVGSRVSVNDLLLTYGDGFVIFDYDIEYGTNLPGSRSGGAIMLEHEGSAWGISSGLSRVPPHYSGVANNNFITRTLDNLKMQSEVERIIKTNLGKAK